MKMSFHEEFEKAFRESGHTTKSLAELVCRSPSTVARWLAGTSAPNDIILEELGQILRNDPKAFLVPGMTYPNGTHRF